MLSAPATLPFLVAPCNLSWFDLYSCLFHSEMSSPLSVSSPSPARGRSWVIAVMGVAVLLLFVLDVALGSVSIPLREVIRILLGAPSGTPGWDGIIMQIRLPKAVTALLAGAALSVGGIQMQTLFRNPLAGPSVLGITSGASLGVAMVTLTSGSSVAAYASQILGWSQGWLIMLAATVGAALVLLLILWVSSRVSDYVVLLIVGIMVGNITLSLVGIWQYFSRPEQIQSYILWTLGSLQGVTPRHLPVLLAAVGIGLGLSFLSSKGLNALLLGENYARSLGLNVRQTRTLVILTTSLLAGAITGFCGPIGFVGIAVPHLTRSLLRTSDHFILIPGVMLTGAVVLLGCDIISQVPGSSTVLPINAITALVGSPVVIWVILKNRYAAR